jgi:hypothetical protein
MKTTRNIALVAMALLFAFASCKKKENDFGGKAEIKGMVTLNSAPVYNAVVRLAFNAKEPTTTFNASTVTDAGGNYEFNSLLPGDYFVTAEYTNSSGTRFTSGGARITIGDKKGTVQADLPLE